jgi:mannose-6-phosphate isomerase
MVIALTHFETLYGFRPIQEICDLVNHIQSFQKILGPEATSEISRAARNLQGGAFNGREQATAAVKKAFLALLETDNEKLEIYATRLVVFAKTFVESEAEDRGVFTHKLAKLILQVHSQHGNDVGIFLMLFMNHVVLEPGEAMFLESGELHAYLEGGMFFQVPVSL